jgi:capsular polysaccharide biosynthesis protein
MYNIFSLWNKLNRRIFHNLVEWVPYNQKFSLNGYYPGIKEFLRQNPDVFYREVFPSFTSQLKLAPEFVVKINPELKPQLNLKKPEAYILNIPEGRIYSDIYFTNVAVIDRHQKVLGGVSFQFRDGKTINQVKENRIFRHKFFKNPKYVDGTVFNLVSGGGSAGNYFHWMYDSLTKLAILKESGIVPDYYLVPSMSKEFQKQTLKELGISTDRVIDFSKYHHIQAKQLIVTNSAGDVENDYVYQNIHYPDWAVNFLRNAFVGEKHNFGNRKIYISRADAGYRKIINEQEISEIFRQLGFEIHHLSNLSIREQVELFASADVVVSPHGAGLANIAFCRPGSKVLEIFSNQYVKGLYGFIAGLASLNYNFLVGIGVNHHDPNKSDIYLEPEKLIQKMKKLQLATAGNICH